jgi:hypothetical protein
MGELSWYRDWNMTISFRVWLPTVMGDFYVFKNAQNGSGADPNNGKW